MSGSVHRSHPQDESIPRTPVPVAQSSSRTLTNGASPRTQSSQGGVQATLTAAYLQDYILKISSCNTIGELLRIIPVPVQPVSRDILDGVYQASQKLGTAEALLLFWRDRLRSERFADVSQLNSIKAPVVQVCKEAIGPGDGGLSTMTLDDALRDAKKGALNQMINIKQLEVSNLRTFVQSNNIVNRLRPAWDNVLAQQVSMITAEHAAIIAENDVIRKVAQIAASISESSSQRAKFAKEKRATTKKDADINMTDVSGPGSQKQLVTLVEEALKRREQSRRDRAQTGKGKGRTGTPKKQKIQKKEMKKKGAPRKSKRTRPGKPPKRR